MSSDRDHLRPDPPYRREYDYDDDYDDRFRRRRYDPRYAASQDDDHLRILSVLYYVLGGLMLMGGIGPLILIFVGVAILSSAPGPYGPPPEVGWMPLGIGVGLGVFLVGLAACNIVVGYSLGQRKNYLFCFVIACLICINMPLGTILGVFTLLVLSRPSVKESFAGGPVEAP